jgi:hypothetical protein
VGKGFRIDASSVEKSAHFHPSRKNMEMEGEGPRLSIYEATRNLSSRLEAADRENARCVGRSGS